MLIPTVALSLCHSHNLSFFSVSFLVNLLCVVSAACFSIWTTFWAIPQITICSDAESQHHLPAPWDELGAVERGPQLGFDSPLASLNISGPQLTPVSGCPPFSLAAAQSPLLTHPHITSLLNWSVPGLSPWISSPPPPLTPFVISSSLL